MLELILAVIVLVSILVAALPLIRDLYCMAESFFRTGKSSVDLKVLLAAAIQLIIAVEFVKMLAKHSPASAVEVVLFVIAKRVILDESTSVEMLLGVLSLAILFAIRKYLFTGGSRLDEGFLFKADTPVQEVCELCKVHIPASLGETLADVVEGEFSRLGKSIRVREKLVLEDASIMIYSIDGDGGMDVLEVWNRKRKG